MEFYDFAYFLVVKIGAFVYFFVDKPTKKDEYDLHKYASRGEGKCERQETCNKRVS